MDDSLGSEFLVISILICLGWLIPIVNIVVSKKTSGGEKTAWLLAVVFVSWFAWIFYLLLAPLKPRR